MAGVTRKTRVVVQKEDTENVLKLPDAAGDYLPVLEDFDGVVFALEDVPNTELTASIGEAKGSVGFETATGSLPFYLKGSGVEGQAPSDAVNAVLEAAFGSVTVAGVEYDTVAGSTTTVLNVDTGEGVNFQVGQAVLVKDTTNGYAIRTIRSISGDALTLDFPLSGAPASGVNLGLAVQYVAADSGFPSLSVLDYRGNGEAIFATSGARNVSLSIAVEAGAAVTATAEIEGVKVYYNPLEITATSNDLDFTDDGGAKSITLATQVFQSPIEAASVLETALNDASSQTVTVSYSNTTGLFSWTATGTTFDIDWATTTDTLGAVYGFTADDSGTLTGTSDAAITLTSPQTPVFDSTSQIISKDNPIYIGDGTTAVCFPAQTVEYVLSTPKTNEESICEESGIAGSVINARTVELTITGTLQKYDVEKFDALLNNTSLRFIHNFGVKDSSGNWVPGKAMSLSCRDIVIKGYEATDLDGLTGVVISARAHVDSSTGDPETSLNQL